MLKRPLLAVSCLFILFLLIARAFDLPPYAESKEEKEITSFLDISGNVEVTGGVAESRILEEYSSLLLNDCTLKAGTRTYHLKKIKITFKENIRYAVGFRLCVSGKLKENEEERNPGQFDSALYNRISDIGYRMSNPSVKIINASADPIQEFLAGLREYAAGRIREVYPEDARGVLSAVLIGDKTMLDDGDKTRWQMGGISHMLVISGLHLTLLIVGLFNLLRKIRIGLLPSGIIATAFLVFYAVFTGGSVSVLRAGVMTELFIVSKIIGRTYDRWNAIAFSALLLLTGNPWYLFYSGFLLSYAAVIICAVFTKSSKLMVSLMLYFLTAPLILYNFFELPLFGIFLNLALVPLLPFLLLGGIIGAVFGGFAAFPAIYLVRFYEGSLRVITKFTQSTLILGKPEVWMIIAYYALIILIVLIFRHLRHLKRRLFLLVLLPLCVCIFALRIPDGLSVTFLDVGQGDGIALTLPDGGCVLIDGGSSTVQKVGLTRILPYLKCRGIRRVDELFITHMDKDHICGLQEILTAVRDHTTTLSIGTVALPYLKSRAQTYLETEKLARDAGARILYLSEGDMLSFGDVSFTVMNPNPENEDPVETDENAQCIVLSLKYGNFDALFTGDVAEKGEENLLRQLKKSRKKYEVLKVAHHGSRLSTSKEFLYYTRPSVSVISVGNGNFYGHPHAALLARLRECGTDIFETRDDGAVTVHTEGDGFTVATYINGDN